MIIARQSARNAPWLSALVGAALGGVALLFIPGSSTAPWLWAGAMGTIAALLAHWTLVQHSWLNKNAEGHLTLCIRDNNARATTYIDQHHIVRVEPCIYRLFTGADAPEWVTQTHHRQISKPGYAGPGLIVQYRIPPQISGDNILRSHQFPAPAAQEMLHKISPPSTHNCG